MIELYAEKLALCVKWLGSAQKQIVFYNISYKMYAGSLFIEFMSFTALFKISGGIPWNEWVNCSLKDFFKF